MHYEGALYRPPSESQSLLVQLTTGCSYNRCTYCAMYQDVQFRVKPLDEVLADIKEGALYRFRRVFLCDGDALITPQNQLVEVLKAVREHMPWTERVGIYGDTRSILKRKVEDLMTLRNLGLGIIYHGIETGDDVTLKAIRKGATAKQIVTAGQRVREAGITYSAIVMLGIAGRSRSQEHAAATAEVLNAIQPEFIGVLTTMVVEGTPLSGDVDAGRFRMPSRLGLLEELHGLLSALDVRKGLLTTQHASNYLPLRVVLPYEKEQAMELLKDLIDRQDTSTLRPDCARDL
ncbi:MAG: radical SAM protein [Deltaproteobacteria bacterium]|nr:radical SAM protein [Deltaproteobacteria bacterium]